jgi:hypothetical protein
MANPYARVRSDAKIRRMAKEAGVTTEITRRVMLLARVCDLCGPADYLEWLRHDERDRDFVQRQPKDGTGAVWVHRNCAPMWEWFDELTLPELERIDAWLTEQLVKEQGH